MGLITVTLGIMRLEIDPDHQTDLRCPSCHDGLGLHQPDVESPDHLLGTCPGCRAWFLVDISSGVMVRLPDRAALQET